MFINNLAYEASAGSGKTFMLVVRYLSLLFKGADASKILALTFTNKAASEMSERIVETLEELEKRDELKEIIKVTNISKNEILQNRKRVLNLFLNSNTKIMTIDSFFTKILKKFSLYASLMPDFSTHTSQHDIKLLNRFLKEVSVAKKQNLLINLSLESKKRVSDIFSLLDEFYNKKEELKEIKFQKPTYIDYEKMVFDELKELEYLVSSCKKASKSLKDYVSETSFEKLKTRAWILKDTLSNDRTFKTCYVPEFDIHLQNIQELIKQDYRQKEQNFFYSLYELVDIYQKSKKALYIDDSELGFSDVTQLVYEILNRLKDSEFLYFRIDAMVEHILLDEFQDTSILQYKILKPLIDEITSGSGIFEDGSFFFVGDVKQSIYRFRGGVSELFHEVANKHNTKIEKLKVNYRSKKEIVEFVNRTFSTKIKNYTNQLTKDGADGGYVDIIVNDELLDEVLNIVQNLISKGANLNDIAILCATNKDGDEIKTKLSLNNIDVVTETTTKLINQQSVKAILEYLKYLYFKEDIYRYNFFSLIERDLEDIEFIDLNKIKLFDIVKNIVDRYELFFEDFNIIRFLNAINRYDDIEALIFEYERLDESASAHDISGVRILTVHKSKGLEYKNVLVVDRLRQQPNSSNTIIYEYDGINLLNVYLRTSKRKELDKEYANALKKEDKLSMIDSFNALYVAFTRARDNLFIIKKSEKSDFDILDLDTKDTPFGTLVCDSSKKDIVNRFQPFDYIDIAYGVQNDLLSLEDDTTKNLEAINFGIALHYTLEMMEDFSLRYIDNAIDMMLNKYGFLLSEREVEDIISRIKNLIKNRKFLSLIDGEIYKEKAIKYKNNLRYIDLLVKKDDSYVIIDYKSSKDFHDKHITQVKGYIRAIKEITNSSKVEGYLCYILDGVVDIESV